MAASATFESATLHGVFAHWAANEPQRPALREGDRQTTFGELWSQAGELAGALENAGVTPGDVIALALPRSTELVIASLAGLRAGGVILALDLRSPNSRNRALVESARARWSIVADGSIPDCVQSTRTISVSSRGERSADSDPSREPSDPAFIVFTSGSSGDPKGVVLAHGAMVARVRAETHYGFEARDAHLMRISPAFVGWPVGLAILACGIRYEQVSDSQADDPLAIAEFIESRSITLAGFPPRLLEGLLDLPDIDRRLGSLRVVRSFGEALPRELVARVRAALPSLRLVNGYGTTETTGVVLAGEAATDSPAHEASSGLLPLDGVIMRVVDEDRAPTVEGEIWIAAPLLSAGYLDGLDPDEKFVDTTVAGERHRWYRTGDRGRAMPGGRVIVLGRLDVQLNVNGVRADPAEIEGHLKQHPAVADAAVWMHPDGKGRPRLIAYVVDRGERAMAADLREFLAARLPVAVVPTRFVRLESLPLTPSRKIHRPGLPPPEAVPRRMKLPDGKTEETLLTLFRETLEESDLGVDDDFFEWGGDSVKAFELMSRLADATGITLPATILLTAPTVELLAQEYGRATPARVSAMWLTKEKGRTPLIMFPGLIGDPMVFLSIARSLGAEHTALGISWVSLHAPTDVESLVSETIRTLRDLGIAGPYFLAGYSLGGILAFEVGRALIASGERVAFIGLIDTVIPGLGLIRKDNRWARLRRRVRNAFEALLRGKARPARPARPMALPNDSRPLDDLVRAVRRHRTGDLTGAIERHRVQPCAARVVLFRASQSHISDPLNGWGGLAQLGVDVVWVPGDHRTLMSSSRAKDLGARIGDAVTKSRRAAAEGPAAT